MSLARFSLIVKAGKNGCIAKKQVRTVGSSDGFGAIRTTMEQPMSSESANKIWAESTKGSAIGTAPKDKSIVICGRNTYQGLPGPVDFKQLQGRNIIVVSSSMRQQDHQDVAVSPSLKAALEKAATVSSRGRVWVVGGYELFREALEDWWYLCDEIRYIRFKESYSPRAEDIIFPIPFKVLATSYVLFAEPFSTNLFDVYRFSPVLTWKKKPLGIFELNLNTGKSFNSKESGEVRVVGKLSNNFRKCPDDCYLKNREMYDIHAEYGYLQLLQEVLQVESSRPNRTGIDTLSIFAPPDLKFRLYDFNPTSPSFGKPVLPVITTKKMGVRTIFRELEWFIKGQTNSKALERFGVNIWKGNTSEDFLFDLVQEGHTFFENVEEGEGGSIYGHQWRNFGALHPRSKEIEEINESEHASEIMKYLPEGVDQLEELVNGIKNSPFSRRHVLLSWNPIDIYERKCVALPACHILAQFYVRREGTDEESRYMKDYSVTSSDAGTQINLQVRGELRLDCKLTIRSSDLFLGLPFNITSYSYLTHMIAHVCDLQPGTLTVSIGDAHIYTNHITQVEQQLTRTPRPFPTIKIRNPRKHKTLEAFNVESFIIDDSYDENCCDAIRGEMAV